MELHGRLSASLRTVVRRGMEHWVLLPVMAVAFNERLQFFRWWKAFPGGDTYNFILIAQELLRGSYPIAEKRLPVYPLLLALLHPVLDWETAAITVAFAASLASIALLYALGRTAGLSKVSLVVALLPFQAIAPFLFQSVRGYADTTFVAFLLASLLAFLRATTWKAALLTGVLFGLTSLTRFEGMFAAAAVLALWLFRKRRIFVLPTTLGLLLCVVPFVLLSLKVGRPLLPAEYLADAAETAFGVKTVREFTHNYAAIWQSVGVDRLWQEPRRLLRDLTAFSFREAPRRVWSFLQDPKEAPSLLLLAGIAYLCARRARVFIALLLPFLVLALPIAWWGVRQRFLILLYPLFYFVLAAGAHALLLGVRALSYKKWWRRLAPTVATVGLVGLALFPWRSHTAAEAREVREKNLGKDYAYYQAIQAARRLPGVIAFAHRSSIALALFGEPDRGRAVFADSHLRAPNAEEQWRLLERWNVAYLVVVEGAESAAFAVLSSSPYRERLALVQVFEYPRSRGGPSRASLYAVTRAVSP